MKLLRPRIVPPAIDDEDEGRFCAEVCAYPLKELRIVLERPDRDDFAAETRRFLRTPA